jgi:hypothetical protein
LVRIRAFEVEGDAGQRIDQWGVAAERDLLERIPDTAGDRV